MRKYPGRPRGSGFLRSPIDTCVGRVAWYLMRRSRYARLPRSRYNCATEIRAKLWYRVSWKL